MCVTPSLEPTTLHTPTGDFTFAMKVFIVLFYTRPVSEPTSDQPRAALPLPFPLPTLTVTSLVLAAWFCSGNGPRVPAWAVRSHGPSRQRLTSRVGAPRRLILHWREDEYPHHGCCVRHSR